MTRGTDPAGSHAGRSFDAMPISIGLRNVSDIDGGLAELARVTRPGGQLVVSGFSQATWRPLRTVYSGYLMAELTSVERRVSNHPPPRSIWPSRSGRGTTSQPLAGRIGAVADRHRPAVLGGRQRRVRP